MSVSCNFLAHNLTCILPDNTMDVLLKVRTKSGEHTFREDIYTRTLKYRRWNNKLRPFHSLKRRVANIFQKRNSFSDSSRGTSIQMLYNSKVVQKNNRYFDLSSIYFLYPLTSLPYMVMRKRLLPPSSTNSLF